VPYIKDKDDRYVGGSGKDLFWIKIVQSRQPSSFGGSGMAGFS
jgi:hypothetical protein